MDDIITKLDNFAFHDVPVENVSFNTVKTTEFCVKVAFYDQAKKAYSYWNLIFTEIQELNSDSLVLNSESDIEIYGFDYEKKELYKCKIIFLLGSSQPALVVKILCRGLDFIKLPDKNNEKGA
ncbi:hypothetical protein [Aureispira sp. CCB-QB1]|uniref:hypothetical protein n=1 Tax=Aureispira sp. CCB-QB1 TaxID=1313421 RepID=UPI000698385A|nr:hypothetical protein [Aureispira sp. CCB-QB1]